MEEKTICPWCDTEIIWDEDIGAEEFCPHCFGELKEYRTVEWTAEDLADDEDEEQIPEPGSVSAVELERYAAGHDCGFCGEELIKIGMQTVGERSFRSFTPAADLPPLVTAPFVLDVNMCPSCLQVQYSLGELERKKWQKRGL